MQHILALMDWGLAAIGLGLLARFVFQQIRHSGQDELLHAPIRSNNLREDTIAFAVLAYLAAAAILSWGVNTVMGEEQTAARSMVIGTGAHLTGIAACLLVAAQRFEGGAGRFLWGDRRAPGNVRLIIGLSLLALGVCPVIHFSTVEGIKQFLPGFEPSAHATIEALRDPDRSMPAVVLFWISAAVIAPIAEEVFFRGLLQTLLVTLTRSRWAAIVLASAAFGAIHFQQAHAALALAWLAVLMGFAYERTGSLVPPIVIHSVFNLKTLVWESLGGAAV